MIVVFFIAAFLFQRKSENAKSSTLICVPPCPYYNINTTKYYNIIMIIGKDPNWMHLKCKFSRTFFNENVFTLFILWRETSQTTPPFSQCFNFVRGEWSCEVSGSSSDRFSSTGRIRGFHLLNSWSDQPRSPPVLIIILQKNYRLG